MAPDTTGCRGVGKAPRWQNERIEMIISPVMVTKNPSGLVTIGTLNIHNTGDTRKDAAGLVLTKYNVQYLVADGANKWGNKTLTTTVWHDRDDSIIRLMDKVWSRLLTHGEEIL